MVQKPRSAGEEHHPELREERHRRGLAERVRQTEADLNRPIRAQIARLHRESGWLADWSDLRPVVLHLAMTQLGAAKGILFSREEPDAGGALTLVCSEGFVDDPSDSLIAERFANQGIERDQTIREDAPDHGERAGASAADREIENLVAIPIYIRDEFSGVVVCANKPGGFGDHDEEVLLLLGDHAGGCSRTRDSRSRPPHTWPPSACSPTPSRPTTPSWAR